MRVEKLLNYLHGEPNDMDIYYRDKDKFHLHHLSKVKDMVEMLSNSPKDNIVYFTDKGKEYKIKKCHLSCVLSMENGYLIILT